MVTYNNGSTLVFHNIAVENNGPVAVYNLQGICVSKATTAAEALETLTAGLYIVNGKKIMK